MDEMCHILSVRLDAVGREGALARIKRALRAPDAAPLAVFTVNPEMLHRSTRDAEVRRLLNSGDLNVADGVGTVWAARRLGSPLPERIPGIELGEAALKCAAGLGIGVFILGGCEQSHVAQRAAEVMAQRIPGLNVCGTHHGYFDPDGDENEAVINAVNASGAGLLIVCLGSPRQERWIIQNRSCLPNVRVAMALGGSVDVWAGQVRRAPRQVRQAGLEWLWRLVMQPSRLRRAASLPAFACLTLREAHRLSAEKRSEGRRLRRAGRRT